MIYLYVGIAIWVISGIIGYGYSFGFCQREYSEIAEQDYWVDLKASLKFGLLGVFGLLHIWKVHRDNHEKSSPFRHGMKFW